MHDKLGSALLAGSEQFAETVHPVPVGLVRTRGDRRRQRAVVVSAVLAIVAVTGVLTGYEALAGAMPGHDQPVTRQGHSLNLVAPRRYVEGVPNPVSFTIPGTGWPGMATVQVELGKPRYLVYREPVVLRRDPTSGRWVAVPLTPLHGSWLGSYTVRVPAGSTRQRLLVVLAVPKEAPPWGAGRLRVRVVDVPITRESPGTGTAGQRRFDQQGPHTVLAPLTGAWQPSGTVPIAVPRSGSRQLTFTVRNPIATSYRLRFYLYAFLCPNSPCSRRPAGISVQWLDAGTWRTLGAAAWRTPGNGQLLQTASLAPRGALTLTFRVLVTATGPSATGELIMNMELDRASFPGPAGLYTGVDGRSSLDSGIITTG
jgi:hypothetical protein